MKRYRTIMTAAVLALAAAAGQMTGCGTAPSSGETAAGEQTESAGTVEEMIAQAGSGQAEITLNGDSASVSGTGASVSGGVVTITDGGTYSVTGSLEEGQIRVEAGDEDTVVLELNGAEVTNQEEAAIHVENAGQTVILLGDGTVNRIQSGEETEISAGAETAGETAGSDAAEESAGETAADAGTETGGQETAGSADTEAGEPDAADGEETEDASGGAIYARDDLAISGTGTLQVLGYINNGIQTSNDLLIDSGTVEVTAVNNGIKGKDSVTITGGTFAVTAGGDGIKSDDTTGEGFDVVSVSGGTFTIDAQGDGIQAETDLDISGGDFTIVTAGGSPEAVQTEETGGDRPGAGGMDRPEGGAGRPGGAGGRQPAEGGGAPGDGAAPADGTAPADGAAPEGGAAPGNGTAPEGGAAPEDGAAPADAAARKPGERPAGGGRGQGGEGVRGGEGGEDRPGEPGEEPPAGEDFSDSGWDMEDEGGTSTKGIKSGTSLTISGGTFYLDTLDDAIHSNGTVAITGGSYEISTGDDGIHGDMELTVEDGNIQILQSYEGLEANQITISGGQISVVSSDDGINASGGPSGRGMGGAAETSSDGAAEMPNIYILGGEITVDAGGDGVDSNGNFYVEGGTLIIDGPSGGGNGSIDVGTENGGVCEITGGTVLAVGSSGMLETFGSGSAQYSFCCVLDTPLEAGGELTISDSEGNVLISRTAKRQVSSVIFSSPDLKDGETYTIGAGEETMKITLNGISTMAGETVFRRR